jgi:hypothetical protein
MVLRVHAPEEAEKEATEGFLSLWAPSSELGKVLKMLFLSQKGDLGLRVRFFPF